MAVGCSVDYVPFLKFLIYKVGLNASAENHQQFIHNYFVQDEIQRIGNKKVHCYSALPVPSLSCQ